MLFNSLEYLLFFIVVLAISWMLGNRMSLRIFFLLLASYFFYASNNHWLIVLIMTSTVIDYIAGINIANASAQSTKRLWLISSLVSNLSILLFFKYFNFFASSFSTIVSQMGFPVDWVDLNILLPVGISFYTFQSMSYSIDVYMKRIPAEHSFIRFACYISFFPQLVAGPIVRAREFLPQFRQKLELDADTLDEALFRIISGLTKKIVLADFLSRYADALYNSPGTAGSFESWIGIFAFSFQIYFDFSGYTDIAIGCALLLGFRLPDNFNRPYAAQSFSEFWRRWHLTLSYWFRDYLYIPLGGSHSPYTYAVYFNLLLTMLLCGLWHGAAWTFVLWGGVHGVLLCVERFFSLNRISGIRKKWRAVVMFLLITLTWIPFRANSIEDAGALFKALTSVTPPTDITLGALAAIVIMAGAWVVQLYPRFFSIDKMAMRLPVAIRGALYACLWATIMVFNASGATEFIYFKF